MEKSECFLKEFWVGRKGCEWVERERMHGVCIGGVYEWAVCECIEGV